MIQESIALLCMRQVFRNPKKDDQSKPLEVTYQFPVASHSVISKLTISIGDDRVIEAKVIEKEEAEKKYEDKIAAGHGAVLMKESRTNTYELTIGNIQPGQDAIIILHILQPVVVDLGIYDFILPAIYLPTINKSGKEIKSSFSFAI